MEKTRREIMDRVYLTYLPAKKFKTGCLSAQFITPLRRETASCGALLPLVLQRGTMRCPDIQQLSAAMDQLYGAQINPTIRKRAECQCIGFVASVMDDSFAPRGEKLLEPTAALLAELHADASDGYAKFALTEMTQGDTPEELRVCYAWIHSTDAAEGFWGSRYTLSGDETFLPDVTASDNGKFLRVSNGAWAAAAIDNANGGSF